MKIKLKIAISVALFIYFSIALYGCIRTQTYWNGAAVFVGVLLAVNLLKISLGEQRAAIKADLIKKKEN